jgi:hypothetical protein
MVRKITPLLMALALASVPVFADENWIPPVAWGEPPTEVIEHPYRCRGPMPLDEDIEIHMCNEVVLGHEAVVTLYFVDGDYACFSVTMRALGSSQAQIRHEFDTLVGKLESTVGQPSGRDGTPKGEPRATWLTERETIRAVVESTGGDSLIGIVALADEHHQRVARLVNW